MRSRLLKGNILFLLVVIIVLCGGINVNAAKHLPKGKVFYDAQYKYRVTNAGNNDHEGTAQIVGYNPDYKKHTGWGRGDTVYLGVYHVIYDVTGESFLVNSIAKNAFKNCKNIYDISVNPAAVYINRQRRYTDGYLVNIPEGCFKGCSKLRYITIISNKKFTINKNAFSGCKILEQVWLGGSKFTVKKGAFNGVKKINVDWSSSSVATGTYIKKLAKDIKKSGAKKVTYTFNHRKYTLK